MGRKSNAQKQTEAEMARLTEEAKAAESEVEPAAEQVELTLEEQVEMDRFVQEALDLPDDARFLLPNNVQISREVALRLRELVHESVLKSNSVKWREEGKRLLAELETALSK